MCRPLCVVTYERVCFLPVTALYRVTRTLSTMLAWIHAQRMLLKKEKKSGVLPAA